MAYSKERRINIPAVIQQKLDEQPDMRIRTGSILARVVFTSYKRRQVAYCQKEVDGSEPETVVIVRPTRDGVVDAAVRHIFIGK